MHEMQFQCSLSLFASNTFVVDVITIVIGFVCLLTVEVTVKGKVRSASLLTV